MRPTEPIVASSNGYGGLDREQAKGYREQGFRRELVLGRIYDIVAKSSSHHCLVYEMEAH